MFINFVIDLVFYKKLFEQSPAFKLVQVSSKEYLPNILEQSRMAGEMRFIVALSVPLTEELLIQVSEKFIWNSNFGFQDKASSASPAPFAPFWLQKVIQKRAKRVTKLFVDLFGSLVERDSFDKRQAPQTEELHNNLIRSI